MSGVVLDTSAAIALLVESHETAASIAFGAALPDALIAPYVFPADVRHALLKLERRQVIAEQGYEASLADLEAYLMIAEPPETGARAQVMAKARAVRLGYFDALYLEAAERAGAAVASRDSALLAAAMRVGVPVVDLR